MKRRKLTIVALTGLALLGGGILFAADHIDAPGVTGTASDITDLYVFRGQDTNNLVFVANTQGLLSPGATGAAKFDANTLIEFNIDNDADNVEDLVIQCMYDAGTNKMKVYGPIAPSEKGMRSKVEGMLTAEVDVTTYGSSANIATQNGIKLFAGPRDDPFFFDLNQYKKILGGTATSFNSTGTDAFAGTNVLSIVVEVPKSKIGGSGSINVWVESKKKM